MAKFNTHQVAMGIKKLIKQKNSKQKRHIAPKSKEFRSWILRKVIDKGKNNSLNIWILNNPKIWGTHLNRREVVMLCFYTIRTLSLELFPEIPLNRQLPLFWLVVYTLMISDLIALSITIWPYVLDYTSLNTSNRYALIDIIINRHDFDNQMTAKANTHSKNKALLLLLWCIWFCREVFQCFCREVFGFAVTVVGHHTMMRIFQIFRAP